MVVLHYEASGSSRYGFTIVVLMKEKKRFHYEKENETLLAAFHCKTCCSFHSFLTSKSLTTSYHHTN